MICPLSPLVPESVTVSIHTGVPCRDRFWCRQYSTFTMLFPSLASSEFWTGSCASARSAPIRYPSMMFLTSCTMFCAVGWNCVDVVDILLLLCIVWMGFRGGSFWYL